MERKHRILIVEDEQTMAKGLAFNFEQEEYEVLVAGDGPTALGLFDANQVDLIILDLMLPGMSGYEVCKAIRERDAQVPVLVLSARSLSEDRALAFDAGTDQYLSKPFALPELLTRVRNLIERRAALGRKNDPQETVETFGDVAVDFRKFEVTAGGRTQSLTTLETDLLRYFLRHEGTVLSRSRILEDVWDQSSEITTRTVDNFVMRLRKLIESDPTRPRHLLSVRGTGYKFVRNPEV